MNGYDPAMAARQIIAKFGGPSSMARTLTRYESKTVPASTVQCWQNSGIPVKWQGRVLTAAKLAAVPVALEDFFVEASDA